MRKKKPQKLRLPKVKTKSGKSGIFRLNTFYGKKMGRTYAYKYFCKSRSFRANFNDAWFRHVNFRGSILTSCWFRRCRFIGVEFLGTNLRKSNFEGAHFKDTIFVGSLLDDCNFTGATFENAVFVNTSVEGVKGLNADEGGITVLKQYPTVDISPALKAALDGLRENPHVGRFKVLHLTTKKYNQLSLAILLASFSEEQLILGLTKAKDDITKDMCTVSCLKEYLSRSLRL